MMFALKELQLAALSTIFLFWYASASPMYRQSKSSSTHRHEPDYEQHDDSGQDFYQNQQDYQGNYYLPDSLTDQFRKIFPSGGYQGMPQSMVSCSSGSCYQPPQQQSRQVCTPQGCYMQEQPQYNHGESCEYEINDQEKSYSHRCPALAASSSSSSWRPYDPNQKYDVYTGRYEDPQADYSDISDDELSHDAPHTEEEHDSYYFNRRHKQRMKTASRRGTKYVQHADDPENQDDNNFPDGDTVIETKFKDGSSNQCIIKEEPYLYVSAHSFEDENKVPWWKNFARSEYDDKNRLTQMVYELLDKQHWKSTVRRKLRKNLVQSDAIRFLHRHGWSSTSEEKLKIARGIMKRKGPILPVPEYDESQK